MEFAFIAIAAAIASLLTFFSGFGLATILTPVFAIFFPVEIAVALTGVVHFLNNLFKVGLTRKQIDWRIGLRFGAPAMVGALIGAEALLLFSGTVPLYSYGIGGKVCTITLLKLLVAALMIIFALFEVIPSLKNVQFGRNKLIVGGLVSGFFGGLSGNQGALRSMFLLRCGLSKEGFIATGIIIACAVDVTRLSVYLTRISGISISENIPILLIAVSSAFAGAFLGNKLLKKITLGTVQTVVTVMIILLALALGAGLL